MKSLADTLTVDPARSVADMASITESWETLTDALEAGQMSEGQYAWVIDREPPDDADALVRNLWARQMRRYARDPRGVSVDLDALKTYACRCGPGTKGRPSAGWIFTVETSPVSGLEVVYARPCPECNHRQRELWVDCWAEGGDHRCPKCWRAGGKTPTPLAGDRGVSQDVRDAEQQAKLEAEDALMFESLG